MKTPYDPRHKRRRKLVEELFATQFHKQKVDRLTCLILKKKDVIDKHINKAAPEFPIEKINRIDLAILRLAVYELMIAKKEPPKVIIDEAIELAKEYAGDTSPSFINGALGNIIHEKSAKI